MNGGKKDGLYESGRNPARIFLNRHWTFLLSGILMMHL